jgi:hypothetical protein
MVYTKFTVELPDDVLWTEENVREYAYKQGGRVKSSEMEDSSFANAQGEPTNYIDDADLREQIIEEKYAKASADTKGSNVIRKQVVAEVMAMDAAQMLTYALDAGLIEV